MLKILDEKLGFIPGFLRRDPDQLLVLAKGRKARQQKQKSQCPRQTRPFVQFLDCVTGLTGVKKVRINEHVRIG